MPHDRAAFCNRVFTALGGQYVPNSRAVEDIEGNHLSWDFRRLAAEAPRFVQLEEALGRQPTPEEFGVARLTWPDTVTVDRYATVVRQVRAGPDTFRPTATTAQQAASRVAGTETTGISVQPPVPASPPVPTAPLRQSRASTGQAAPSRPAPEQRPTPAPPSTHAVPAAQPTPAPAEQPSTPPAAVSPAADTAAPDRRPGVLGRLLGRRRASAPAAPGAGWYPDPHVPGQLRWWDGAAWTARIHSR